MGCSPTGYKTFLVVCNIGLLFLGFTILSLGVKMEIILESVRLSSIPLLTNSVKAVVATGFFVSITGAAGFCGSCYEIMWLILVHLAGLGIIVVMEFSVGITLMVIKNTVEAALQEIECGETCYNIVIFVVTKLASGSSGIMLTIIIVEALMIYSAVQLYYYLRDLPKNPPVSGAGPTVVVQNVQMQNMAAPAPVQQPVVMTVPAPQMHVPYGVEHSYRPPPPYSQDPAEQSSTQPYSKAMPQQNLPQSPMVPPLDTSTLTRKAGKV